MSLTISHCVPADAPGYAEAFLATYERMPRNIVLMGSVSRERQLAIFTTGFRSSIESQEHPTSNKETHCLKVTDPAINEIVAFAIWIYWPNGYKMEEDSLANVKEVPEGFNEKLMRDFGSMTVISLLGTHPKHERRGAGAMLIRWGFAQADRDEKRCYVDSSSLGYFLYKRCGFREDVGEMSIDLDRYGAEGVGVHKWVAMLREPQTRASD